MRIERETEAASQVGNHEAKPTAAARESFNFRAWRSGSSATSVGVGSVRSSYEGHTADALASRGDEGRGYLR
jgi:hypothetical protein